MRITKAIANHLVAFASFASRDFALPLAQEGLCAAGDSTGQACAFTALKKDDDRYSKAGEELKDGENEFQSVHLYSILSILTY